MTPKCEKCGNNGTSSGLYLTVDVRWIPEKQVWRLVEREDEGGKELDCLVCDHKTDATPFGFPYETELKSKDI